jgi:hypothetical protein
MVLKGNYLIFECFLRIKTCVYVNLLCFNCNPIGKPGVFLVKAYILSKREDCYE